ncbi:nitrate- and nitrite sensing domain-containing protein [Phytohabitans sp. ZYX-F-186]|uniref:histidine kinase n=1 Tax=Phytohabitans maris TaxID=3071409 RepID=A0ABU0ZLF0_9ACTN|nr:nitrate- and nitrite sensing domain-containing protein [Phytohabitans sp. ZYX-F-186]MDQ7907217.1 nitrate- and nitrite sensing domain-containing protein [Phytohabitans sp. ZYX-F-186]
MLLGRLRIRGKLAVLVMVPLLLVGVLTVPLVVNRAGLAGRAGDTARTVRVASEVGGLVGDLQQERMLSVGYLLGTVDAAALTLQTTAVGDRTADLRASLGDDLPPPVAQAIDTIRDLEQVRTGVLGKAMRSDQVIAAYGAVTARILDSLRLLDNVDVATVEGRQVVALDAVLQMNDLISAGAALMVVMVAERSPAAMTGYTANLAALQAITARFNAYATAEQSGLFQLVQQALNERVGADFPVTVQTNPLQTLSRFTVQRLYPSLESFIVLGRFVERKIVTDVTAEVDRQQTIVLTTAYGVITLALLVLVGVVLMSVVVARAVARPLTSLTHSAERVATVAEAELRRVADEDADDEAEPIHLEPVDVRSADEIGDLARAFDRVQTTAARLVERQVSSRRNVAQMFGHVGRRTQNLVGRQIALIDRLEQEETDPQRLQQLYRLDHVSSRLRRNAGSLVVLSGSAGASGAEEHITPLPLADVVRLALGEIEEYTRVDVQVPGGIAVSPALTGDLVLLLAEVMENATVFSPPHTRVTVTAMATGHVVRLRVVDHGLGLSPERIDEENARLARRERLDLAPTEVLGLFVVGRLARKHGLAVSLSETPGGGVTVTVDIGQDHLVRSAIPEPEPVPPPQPPKPARGLASVRQLHAAPPAGQEEPAIVERAVARAIVATADQDSAFNVLALDRATRTIGSGRTWNAFAPRPATPPVPVMEPAPAAPPAAAPPTAPTHSGLRQRVPGAQLPEGTAAVAERAPAPTGVDAATARALVEEFEAGVRRAESIVADRAVVHSEVPPVIAPPAPGPRAPLSRRVPGATLPADFPVQPPPQVLPDQWSPDPEAARDSLEQFESGVARALQQEGTQK